MKKLLKFLLFGALPGALIWALMFWSVSAWATTYYVSNASPVGSDSYDGTEQTHTTGSTGPWLTIAKVNGSTFSAGDSILFNKGDTWNEMLTIPSSGAAENPITISSYGSGANPIFDESVTKTDWTLTTGTTWHDTSGSAFLGGSVRQVFQDNVRLIRATSLANCEATAGSWYNSGSNPTIYVNLTDGGNPNTDHVVAYPIYPFGIDFNGQSYITVANITAKRPAMSAFDFGYTTGAHDLIMQYVKGSQTGNRVFGGGGNGSNAGNYYNITIDHTTGFDMISEGVWLGYGYGLVVTNNEFYDGHKDAAKGYTNLDLGGILVSCGANGVTIANNYIHDIYDSALMGIEQETGYGNNNKPTNVTYTRNSLVDNQQHYLHGNSFSLIGGDSSDVIHHNLILVTTGNCGGAYGSQGIQGGSGTGGPATGVKVYNNTFLHQCSTMQPLAVSTGASIDAENNICINTAENNMVWLQTNSPASTFKNNLYYGNTGTHFHGAKSGTDYTTLAAWATASGETGGQVANPLFQNASGAYSLASDFTLEAGSPAIGAGTNVGLTTDYIGLPLKTPPDIGALQFDAGLGF